MSNLYSFVSFYQSHPDFFQSLTGKSMDLSDVEIFQSLTGKTPIRLSWTHYSIIQQELTAEGRAWYENEAANEMWSTRTLQRNVSSQYYHRLLQSQDKTVVHDEMMKLTNPIVVSFAFISSYWKKIFPKKLYNPTTFTIFAPMKRKIRTYGGYFEAFMETLKEKEQEKIQYGLLLLKSQDRLPKKFVKLVRDGIYELRTEYGGNIYRVFFIFDEGEIVVLFNGFQKKTQKTPQNEIEKAIKIKEAYYADKQSQNH